MGSMSVPRDDVVVAREGRSHLWRWTSERSTFGELKVVGLSMFGMLADTPWRR